MAEQRWHLWIKGRVQGVFYRASAQREAHKLGITGWIRNLDDGRVELVAEGDEAALQALYDWCQAGPPAARVDDVQCETETPSGEYSEFAKAS